MNDRPEMRNALEQVEQGLIFAYVHGPTWQFMYEPGVPAWQRWFHPHLDAGLIRVGDPDEYDQHEVTLTDLGKTVLLDMYRQEESDALLDMEVRGVHVEPDDVHSRTQIESRGTHA